MPSELAQRFIQGDWDADWWQDQLREWSPVIAGGIFGAAWWVWVDSYVYDKAHEHASPPFTYNWPGIIASLALVMINCVSRDDLQEINEGGEEGASLRARLWLMFSFLLAVGAVGGSVAVLLSTTAAEHFVSSGVGSVIQCSLILASALLFWSFRSSDSAGGYSYI